MTGLILLGRRAWPRTPGIPCSPSPNKSDDQSAKGKQSVSHYPQWGRLLCHCSIRRRLILFSVARAPSLLRLSGIVSGGRASTIASARSRAIGREYGSIENLLALAPELRTTTVFRACVAIAKQVMGRTTMYACDNGLYKEPRGKHGTPWHQDGAFHGKYFPNNTLAFWIPYKMSRWKTDACTIFL
jgi:hypothetical protein